MAAVASGSVVNSRALVPDLDSIASVAAAVSAAMPPSRSGPIISSSAARWRSISVPRAGSNSPRNASRPPTANNSARDRLTVFKKSTGDAVAEFGFALASDGTVADDTDDPFCATISSSRRHEGNDICLMVS